MSIWIACSRALAIRPDYFRLLLALWDLWLRHWREQGYYDQVLRCRFYSR